MLVGELTGLMSVTPKIWVMEGGRVELTKDCGCKAVVDHFTPCEKHKPRDFTAESLKAHLEWRQKVLAEVTAEQEMEIKRQAMRSALIGDDD